MRTALRAALWAYAIGALALTAVALFALGHDRPDLALAGACGILLGIPGARIARAALRATEAEERSRVP